MFKTDLLASSARIDEFGNYRSPNVCFIAPDEEDDFHGGEEDGGQADGEDEGSDLPEEDGDEDGDDEDGEGADHEEEQGAETGRDEEGRSRPVDRDGGTRRRSASDVIRETKREAKEAKARAEAAERRAEEAARRAETAERSVNERRQAESAEQERDRVALMTDAERYEHYRTKDRQESDRRFGQLQFETWEREDKREFRDLCRDEPLYGKVKDRVEELYERMKGMGKPVGREILAKQAIADMVLERSKTAKTKQQRRGAESVRRETTRPARAAGGVASPRARRGNEDTPEARRRRLENITI